MQQPKCENAKAEYGAKEPFAQLQLQGPGPSARAYTKLALDDAAARGGNLGPNPRAQETLKPT
eukprot:122578-Pleurochrysis_carterae.AAC.3